MRSILTGLLLLLSTGQLRGQGYDQELADYLAQVGVRDFQRYEMVLILPLQHSWMCDDFWLRKFIEQTHQDFAKILFVLVIDDRKQLNAVSPAALKRPNLVVDDRSLFLQRSFYNYSPLLLQMENSVVKREFVLNSINTYQLWTRTYTKYKDQGKWKAQE